MFDEPHPPRQPWDVDEFLNWEDQQPERWELIAGQPWRMMVGAPRLHHLLVANIRRALERQVRSRGCEVYSETFKFRTAEGVFYPDVLVHCGPIELNARWTETPRLVVEVMSPATQTTDHGIKKAAYLSTPGLRGYVIVSQLPRGMILFRPDGGIADATAPGETLALEGLDATLAFDEVFEGVPEV